VTKRTKSPLLEQIDPQSLINNSQSQATSTSTPKKQMSIIKKRNSETKLDNLAKNDDEWDDIENELDWEEVASRKGIVNKKPLRKQRARSSNLTYKNSVFNYHEYKPCIHKSNRGSKHFYCVWCERDNKIKNIT